MVRAFNGFNALPFFGGGIACGTGGGDLRNVKDELLDVKNINLNGWAVAALRSDGTVRAWGDGSSMLQLA